MVVKQMMWPYLNQLHQQLSSNSYEGETVILKSTMKSLLKGNAYNFMTIKAHSEHLLRGDILIGLG